MQKEGQTFGKRYEKKYLADKNLIQNYIEENREKLRLKFSKDHYNKETKFTCIENIYFDSYDLESYHMATEKWEERTKLRVRRYAQDGVKDDKLFFEIKSKENKQTLKERVVMNEQWYEQFLATGTFPRNKVIALNTHHRPIDVIETLDRISHYVHDRGWRPMLKSQYIRFAFKLRYSNKLRLTFDTDLSLERLAPSVMPRVEYTKTKEENDIIVEIKYQDKKQLELLPELHLLLGKPRGFSKYCYGIHSTKDVFPSVDRDIHPDILAQAKLDGSFLHQIKEQMERPIINL